MAVDLFMDVRTRYEAMRARDASRDYTRNIVRTVREGRIRELFPDFMTNALQWSVVANKIDTAARDLAEVIAPLPSLRCYSGKMQSDADKARATAKRRIGQNYWKQSRLRVQMFNGADWYLEAGFLIGRVEIDWEKELPVIQLDSPFNAHYDVDRYGCVLRYAKRYNDSASNIVSRFADVPGIYKLLSNERGQEQPGETIVELVHYVDEKNVVLFAPAYSLIISSYAHGLDRCPVVLAVRPGDIQHPRGTYDDVVGTQVAKAVMAQLVLDAADKAVNAPLVGPEGMNELPIGNDAFIEAPGGAQAVGRANIQVPQSAFAQIASLDEELAEGMRYPGLRSGQSNASVITGRGVQQMMGTFDTQIKTAQSILGALQEELTSLGFEMDQRWFPNKTRTIEGIEAGQPYQLTYTPAKDINGLYGCEVTYGFASGSTPQAALVSLLQLQGAGIIDQTTFRENLPFDLDDAQVQQNLDVQNTRNAISGGVNAIAQALGAIVQQGQDPTPTLQLMAGVVKARQEGTSIEDAVLKLLQEKAEKDAAAAQEQAAAAAGGPGGAGVPGVMDNGLPDGVAAGQAGMPAGGLPTVQNLTAGFRGGQPISDSSLRRRQATGGR